MQKPLIPALLTSIVVVCNLGAICQLQPGKELLEKWTSDNPQEKVFLQTDKSQYFGGETIWMKAWCALDGRRHI